MEKLCFDCKKSSREVEFLMNEQKTIFRCKRCIVCQDLYNKNICNQKLNLIIDSGYITPERVYSLCLDNNRI